ncbi:histone-lysine N-methyltransferase PRDM9-like [Littorina saxatilis]
MEGQSSDKIDFSNLNLPESIAEFFSKEENEKMCDFDKLHFKNIRLNYEMMLHFGLPARKPDFMKPNRGMLKRKALESSSESDEDWRPRAKRKKGPKPWSPPHRPPPTATVTSATAQNPSRAEPQKTAGTLVKKTQQKAEKTEEEPRVYSFRKRKETNYMKLEVPNDDEFVYCEECNQEHEGDCPEHGPFLHVTDTPVPVKKRGDPKRAMKTLPPGLEVKVSGIPDAGLGVFATKFFPLRTRFGPYEGRRVKDPDIAHSSGYCWQISIDDRSSHFVDAKECKTANWMRYVNCACTTAEQNVTAYQNCGEIYYRAHTSIPPGAEILVWYGREYGKELGIIRDDEPKRRKPNGQIESDDERTVDASFTFSDIRSSDIEFTDSGEDGEKNKKARQKRKAPSNVNRKVSPGHQITRTPTLEKQTLAASSSLLSQDRPHVCQRCAAAFVQFSSLRIHMASAHGEKLLAVPLESCRADGSVGNHGDRKGGHNKDTGRRHVCDVCNKAFTQAGSLKRHKVIHTGETQFVCDVCNKAFTQAGDLKRHNVIHTGETQFVCDVCNKAFTLAGNLKRHNVIHTGEKQFVCDVCNKAFTQASILKRHNVIHTGEKQFVCDVCNKAFTRAGHLKRHNVIHTGETQFVCDVCNKAFTLAGNLKRHNVIHTGEKQFVCDVCNKAFTRAGHLKRHNVIHTGQKH